MIKQSQSHDKTKQILVFRTEPFIKPVTGLTSSSWSFFGERVLEPLLIAIEVGEGS